MKETKFIEQNKEKWQSIEQLLKDPTADGDELSNTFIQITDDLSYAGTFYPNRSVKVYLNNLSQQIFAKIYKTRKQFFSAFFNFWLKELPLIVWSARKQLLFSLAFFLIATLIGIISTIKDPHFPVQILGEEYMKMTAENIAKGQPMDVYAKNNNVETFLAITLNNIKVAFVTFINGIFFSIGTFFFLLYNGIMLGAFQWYFVQKGVFITSFLSIWLHGTIEISSIIIAGGAGITLGSGLLFPGTYSRWYAFQLSARKAMKIMAGTVPLFIIAGFIETFLTAYTSAPALLKLVLIAASLLFIGMYFIWLPIKRGMAASDLFHEDVKLNVALKKDAFVTNGIKRNGDIMAAAFAHFGKIFNKWLLGSILVSVAIQLTSFFETLAQRQTFYSDAEEWNPLIMMASIFKSHQTFFMFDKLSPFFILQCIFVSVLVLLIGISLQKQTSSKEYSWKSYFVIGFQIYLLTLATFVVFYLPFYISLFIMPVLLSWYFICCFVLISQEIPLTKAIAAASRIYFAGFSKAMGLNFVIASLSYVLILLLITQSNSYASIFLNWQNNGSETFAQITRFIVQFIHNYLHVVIITFWMITNSILYFSLEEMKDAVNLKKSIAAIQPKRKIYGKEFDL